jgi:hypothetical protein
MRRPVVSLLAACGLLAGCAERAPEPPKKDEKTPAAIPAGQTSSAKPSQAAPVTIRRPNVPGDVFFEDPLAIAANGSRVPGAAPAGNAVATADAPTAPGTSPKAESSPARPAAGAPVDWATLLPADQLVAEVARIRDRFAPKLESVATFNNSLLDFPPYMAELAALAGIATEHGGDIPWKGNAKYVRDLAGESMSGELQRGQKSYEQVKTPFEKITVLLDGKKPDGLPESADATDFSAVADFGYLMKRLETGQNVLKNSGGTAAALKQNAADLAREARVDAALSRVIVGEGYGYSDDAKFRGYAADMTNASLDAATAAESGDFAKFDAAFSAMGQSCVKCHGDYRNN